MIFNVKEPNLTTPYGSATLLPAVQKRRHDRLYEAAKRALDVIGACVLLLVFFPAFVVITIAILVSNPGPIIYRHRRLGRGGREFWCYKFRTMVINAEEVLKNSSELRQEFLKSYKLKHDPRVTPVGAFLRKTSLDEIPQIINVLRGEMSLIGPRPIVRDELSKYGSQAEKLLTVKPGLGGVWQVYGRSDTEYAERVDMDMKYIDSRSTWLDIQLLLLTAATVLRCRGAY